MAGCTRRVRPSERMSLHPPSEPIARAFATLAWQHQTGGRAWLVREPEPRRNVKGSPPDSVTGILPSKTRVIS